jgi:hypothetical protein
MYEATSGSFSLNGPGVGDNIYLKLSANCHTGARATILPSTAATVVKQADTDDGRLAAIVLRPHLCSVSRCTRRRSCARHGRPRRG